MRIRTPSSVVALLVLSSACAESDGRPPAASGVAPRPRATHAIEKSRAAPRPAPRAAPQATGPGFPESGPWVSFYGSASQMGDLARVARTFRIIDVDVDPTADGKGNFTDREIAELQAGHRNRVLSYLNLGSCERFRTYWSRVPAGFVPCDSNRAAKLGAYSGYPDEVWMDPGNPDYQKLLLDYVAPRLAARGIDGFFLDNLEIAEHVAEGAEGWCSPACRQGALDLVRKLRERFPDKLLVMQNATGEVTRLGTTGGMAFPALLDGITHEEVYNPAFDPAAEEQLLSWQRLKLRSKNDRPFFVGVEDYVGSCANADAAKSSYAKSRSHGFSPYASDESGSQKVVCYWAF